MIEVNDNGSHEEIKKFLAREDLDNQCLGNETLGQAMQYDFVSTLPPFLKGQKGFPGIGQDLKEATGKHETPVA